jgi:F0F1-type ATP synthase assembly protein I
MPLNEPDSKQTSTALKFTGIAFQMIVIIGLLTFAGYKIDQHFHHATAWATALFSLIGVGVSLFIVFRSLKD